MQTLCAWVGDVAAVGAMGVIWLAFVLAVVIGVGLVIGLPVAAAVWVIRWVWA